MSGQVWALIALCAVTTFAIKAAGPLAFGGRELPGLLRRVIVLLAPALLTALVLTGAAAEDDHYRLGANTIGVAVAGVALWRGASVLVGVAIAVGVTAGVRAVT